MTRPNKPLSGYRGIFTVQAENLQFHYNLAQDANRRNALNADYLEGLMGAAKLLQDTGQAVCVYLFGTRHITAEYTPKIDGPTFEEVEHRFNAVDAQLAKIADSDAACTQLWLFELLRRAECLLGSIDWLADQFEQGELAEYVTAKAGAFADFSHRISPIGLEDGTLGLLDTVNMAADKLLATITMLSDHFAIDDDENRPSDETVFFALQSIKHEAMDIKAVMAAFHAT
ncbi:hypothetical protein [Methylomonas sp. MgM2]